MKGDMNPNALHAGAVLNEIVSTGSIDGPVSKLFRELNDPRNQPSVDKVEAAIAKAIEAGYVIGADVIRSGSQVHKASYHDIGKVVGYNRDGGGWLPNGADAPILVKFRAGRFEYSESMIELWKLPVPTSTVLKNHLVVIYDIRNRKRTLFEREMVACDSTFAIIGVVIAFRIEAYDPKDQHYWAADCIEI